MTLVHDCNMPYDETARFSERIGFTFTRIHYCEGIIIKVGRTVSLCIDHIAVKVFTSVSTPAILTK